MPFAAGTVRDIPVPGLKLCGLTWTGEFLMFSDAVANEVMALDPYSGEVLRHVPCPEVRTDLTTIGGNLVQVVGDRRALRVMDAESGDEFREIPNPRPDNVLCGLEATHHGVWLGYEDLRRIDLRGYDDLELLDTFAVSGRPAGVTVSDNYLAYADHAASTITMVDIDERREVAAFSVAGNPTGITWDGTRIWYCDYTTLQLRAIEVPGVDKS